MAVRQSAAPHSTALSCSYVRDWLALQLQLRIDATTHLIVRALDQDHCDSVCTTVPDTKK